MEIYNTDTQEIFSLLHPRFESDCMGDLTAEDDQIKFNPAEERFEADADTIQWWIDYVEADADFMNEREQIEAQLTEEQKEELRIELSEAMLCDMGDQPAAGLGVLLDWRKPILKHLNELLLEKLPLFNARELCRRSGLDYDRLKNWKLGRVKMLSEDELKRISEVLKTI